MKKVVLGAICVLVLSACGPDAQFVKQSDVPSGSEIGVIPFRDCMIPDQEDCIGSGAVAGTAFASVFMEDGFHSKLLSRPVGPRERLTDEAAVVLAKQHDLDFVINGEVTQFYSVAAGTFRPDRAGVSVHLLRVDNGEIAVSYSLTTPSTTNFTTPADMIEEMAEEVRDELE